MTRRCIALWRRVGLLAILLAVANGGPAWAGAARCPDVADRAPPHLNVLTINLAFYELDERNARLNAIADRIGQPFPGETADEAIDIVLLQEVVGGFLSGTANSAEDLQDKLQARGLTYDLRTVFEAGVPGVLATANAILSRCEIVFGASRSLPDTSEEIEILGLEVPLTRNAMMAQVSIPGAPEGFGQVDVYNTHLCAGGGGSAGGGAVVVRGCDAGERGVQLDAVLSFVDDLRLLIASTNPTILGGDFNMDNFRGGPVPGMEPFGIEKPLYDSVISAGYSDAYFDYWGASVANLSLEELCEKGSVPYDPFPDLPPGLEGPIQDWEPDAHCTSGVSFSGSNGSFAEFFDSTPRRIDYVFQEGFQAGRGEVFFNPNASPPEPSEPVVSDHAGVFVQTKLREPAFAVASDFNADARSDILWRNVETGNDVLWQMDGFMKADTGPIGTVDTAWRLEGLGDFTGDWHSDILWRRSDTGQTVIWQMNGFAKEASGAVGSIGPDWAVVGLGDFNGDGRSDVLWRNTLTGNNVLWLMKGLTKEAVGTIGAVDVAWRVEGLGDFNGDGRADILWRNAITGLVVIWQMDHFDTEATGSIGSVGSQWAVAGIGDFNGDLFADILWRNTVTGTAIIWQMDGFAKVAMASIGAPAPLWQVARLGDTNGDTMTDIVWRNTSNGNTVVWRMVGLLKDATQSIGAPPTAWEVQ